MNPLFGISKNLCNATVSFCGLDGIWLPSCVVGIFWGLQSLTISDFHGPLFSYFMPLVCTLKPQFFSVVDRRRVESCIMATPGRASVDVGPVHDIPQSFGKRQFIGKRSKVSTIHWEVVVCEVYM